MQVTIAAYLNRFIQTSHLSLVNWIYTGSPKTSVLANNNAAFHQGLHCLLRLKQPSRAENHQHLENSEQWHTFCINLYGKINKWTQKSDVVVTYLLFSSGKCVLKLALLFGCKISKKKRSEYWAFCRVGKTLNGGL